MIRATIGREFRVKKFVFLFVLTDLKKQFVCVCVCDVVWNNFTFVPSVVFDMSSNGMRFCWPSFFFYFTFFFCFLFFFFSW